MMDKGHSRDSVQCRAKVKELRQAYQKTKEANGRSGAGPKTCRFYAELHAILGGCATSTPPLSVDSDVGVVISAMAEDYADGEEYDEEADEDDLAESTQPSVSPNSQELFLTQTELASQPSQDNEAMEGTSAANFSSLSTPSQRLSKIRRRKKKTREEMFTDIMEVTCKERAHLNEWKAVVSNYRKDASEREDRRDTRDERWRQEDRQEDQRWRQEDQLWQDATLGLLLMSNHPGICPRMTFKMEEGLEPDTQSKHLNMSGGSKSGGDSEPAEGLLKPQQGMSASAVKVISQDYFF
ncbi:uncharacterized protein ACDP82_021084 [Pangshura tecta]